MLIKVTSDNEITLPAEVLKWLHVRPGDHIELERTREGFKAKPKRQIDLSLLGTLADKIPPDHEPFDIHVVRERMIRGSRD